MRKAKTSKMTSKKRAQEQKVLKTAKRRSKRLENKRKREELLKIDPLLSNITIVSGNTFINGMWVEIKNNKIIKKELK